LVRVVLGTALRRDEVLIANELGQRARRESVGVTFPWLRGKITEIERRYTAAAHPMIGNPADELSGLASWSTSTGVEIIDRWIRYVSGDPNFIAGDPGTGKTTLGIAIAGGTSAEGIPTLVLLSEPTPLEYQLGMLSQLQRPGLDADLMNDLRFNPDARKNKANISKVRQAWDNTYAAAPLRIAQVAGGPDEVISLVASLPTPHVIIIDHAFNVVKQTSRSAKEGEHIVFYDFFQNIQRESIRGNHISLIFNHYTKAGRAEKTRGADAQYGGNVQGIAGSMWHLRRPSTDMADTPQGHQLVLGQYMKIRARLVVDESGNRVDPLKRDSFGNIVTQKFYHNHLWRSIQTSIYQEPEPIPFG